MKLASLLRCSGALALLISATAVQAGSDRWIMRTSVPEMTAQGLVHVRLADAGGAPIESDGLKEMVVHDGDCRGGAALTITKDYKFGFFPQGRVIGLFLKPAAWQGKPLCFDLPGQGVVSATLPDGSAGQSITLTLSAATTSMSGHQVAAAP